MTEPADHRSIAVATYNRCWDLLETTDRSADQNAELLTCAFASRHHWLAVGGAPQAVTAEWMISRAACEVGNPELAVQFAHRAFDLVQSGVHPAWLRASVFEGMGRAHAVNGEARLRDQYLSLAWLVLDQEPDPENRAVIEEQLHSVPMA